MYKIQVLHSNILIWCSMKNFQVMIKTVQAYVERILVLQNDCDTGVEDTCLFADHVATLIFLSQFTGEVSLNTCIIIVNMISYIIICRSTVPGSRLEINSLIELINAYNNHCNYNSSDSLINN